MNKRIKELAADAGYPDYMTYGQDKVLEKFADLLIKQCGQWIIDNASTMEHLGPEYFAQAMIKELGVE